MSGLIETDRDKGVQAIRHWWDQTTMAPLGFVKYPDAVAYYESKWPDFFPQIYKATKDFSQSEVIKVFGDVAATFGDRYPDPADFASALAEYSDSWSAYLHDGFSSLWSWTSNTAEDVIKVQDTAVEVIKEGASAASFAYKYKWYLIAGGVGLAVLFYARPLLNLIPRRANPCRRRK